jgi:hypothetical protein
MCLPSLVFSEITRRSPLGQGDRTRTLNLIKAPYRSNRSARTNTFTADVFYQDIVERRLREEAHNESD